MIVDTSCGETLIAFCGPVIPDVGELPSGYGCSYFSTEYKEKIISKTISKWLNNKDTKITEARLISMSDAVEQFRDLGAYLKGVLSYEDESVSELEEEDE